jgi:hypothetical protein
LEVVKKAIRDIIQLKAVTVRNGALPLIAGSSPAGVIYDTVVLLGEAVRFPMTRVVTLVSWAFAPEWLTIQEASELSGHNADALRWLIQDRVLDTKHQDDACLIEKASLREFQEALLKTSRC